MRHCFSKLAKGYQLKNTFLDFFFVLFVFPFSFLIVEDILKILSKHYLKVFSGVVLLIALPIPYL